MALILPDRRLTELCVPLEASISLGAIYPLIFTYAHSLKCWAIISVCQKQSTHLLIRYPISKMGEKDFRSENDQMYYDGNGKLLMEEFKKFRHSEEMLSFIGYSDEFITKYYPDYGNNILDMYRDQKIIEDNDCPF